MKNWKNSCHPYAMITVLLWSLAYVLTRIALRYFSAFPLGFLRYFIASGALLYFAVRSGLPLPDKADLKWFLASGASGFFLYMLLFNKGCETVAASTSSLIIATVPVITALLARYIHNEKLSRSQWFAMTVEFTGVILLTLMNGIFKADKGVFWLLLAAVSLSVYNLLQRRLTRVYSALQTSSYSIFAGTALLSVFFPAAMSEAGSAPPVMIISVLILGIFSSAAAYVSWSQAMAKAKKTSSVSNYMFVTPLLASLLGFLIAGEKPDAATITGGVIILAGLLIYNYDEKKDRTNYFKN